MDQHIISKIKKGAIGVMPTDTIYGIVGSALSPEAVERIYQVRKRDPKKPMLILISSIKDLKIFHVDLKPADTKVLEKFWPGKVTIILPLTKEGVSKFKYLHRGKNTLAFRLPAKPEVLSIIKKSGPLVAPSANLQGKTPAANVAIARMYFGDNVDFYASGRVSKTPSRIISYTDGKVSNIR